MLDYKGHAISNGRPKAVEAKAAAPPLRVAPRTPYAPTVRPRPRFPAYGNPNQSPAAARPGMIGGIQPPRIHAEFQGAIHGGSTNARYNYYFWIWLFITAFFRPTQQTITTARFENDSGSSKKIATQVGNIGIILLVLALLLFAVLAIVYLRKKRAKAEENKEKSDQK
jgi:hypothetical protein